MKPYPNEELDRMSKREIIRLYKRTVEQFNDAVPVIRCEDCRWYDHGENEIEEWFGCKAPDGLLHPMPDEFCSRAERREDEV